MRTHPTTPFGRRPLSLAMVASQASAEEFAARADASAAVVHKWRLFRAATEAKERLGVTDRALSVLHALLSFHQETALTLAGGEGASDDAPTLIVFPSNRELSIRAHGMAPATLRRHLASLVEAGLILRRDSPNGKRFARRGQGGEIADAFGFDLTPLLARAEEIERLAEEVRAENRTVALLREKITVTRRDIVKMIEAGMETGVSVARGDAPGGWEAFHLRYAALAGRYGRRLERVELERLAAELAALATEIRRLLEAHVKEQNPSGNESQIERHIQNQTTNFPESEPSLQKGSAEALGPMDRGPASTEPVLERIQTTNSSSPSRAFPLGMVLDACPDIHDFALGGIADWRDFAAAAETARSALGVSPDAWRQAQEALGAHDAAIVVAAILQRGDEIKSAGGYLRALTEKARAGAFSVGPALMALLRGRAARVRKKAG